MNVCRTSDLKLLPSAPSNHKSTYGADHFFPFIVPFLINLWTKWHKTKQTKRTGSTSHSRLPLLSLVVKEWLFGLVGERAKLSEYHPRSPLQMAWTTSQLESAEGAASSGTSNFLPLEGRYITSYRPRGRSLSAGRIIFPDNFYLQLAAQP